MIPVQCSHHRPNVGRRRTQIGRIFNLSLVEKRLGNSPTVTRSIAPMYFKRILVVGNGNIDVGKKAPTRKGGKRIVERLTGRDGSVALRIDDPNPRQKEPVKVCGAMSQQYGDGGRGNESAPQKFVHLVGYRDPKPRPEPWVRPSVS